MPTLSQPFKKCVTRSNTKRTRTESTALHRFKRLTRASSPETFPEKLPVSGYDLATSEAVRQAVPRRAVVRFLLLLGKCQRLNACIPLGRSISNHAATLATPC